MLKKKQVYVENFMDGEILLEVSGEQSNLKKHPFQLEIWFRISQDDGVIEHVIGIRIPDDSIETIEKELQKILDNGWMENFIKGIKEEADEVELKFNLDDGLIKIKNNKECDTLIDTVL